MSATDLFTLSDLALQVGNNLGAVDDLSLEKCKKYINRALIRFSELGTWSFQYKFAQALPTVAAQEEYSVTGFLKINSLYMSAATQRTLRLLEDRQFRAMYPNNTASGSPYFWRRTGSSITTANTIKIGVYPIPDAIYALKFDGIAPITLLSSDTQDIRVVTGMPSPLVDLVIEMATAIGWKEIDDGDARKQMEECLVRLKAAYGDDSSEIDDRLIMSASDEDGDSRYMDPVLPGNFGY